MVTAVRVNRTVSKDSAKWFFDTLGFDDQELKELVLDAPHVKMGMKVAGDYKLDVPKVDGTLVRAVDEKKKAAGVDDFK
jgi:hypothetical protein